MTHSPTLLLIGASRGLGLAMTAEFLQRGWNVIGTVRGDQRTALHDLAETWPVRVTIEQLDITAPDQISALRERLSGRNLDMLFVNAGTTNDRPDQPIAQVPTETFVHVMLTNALGPMRAIEAFEDLVTPAGLIGVMSSGQGSLTNNQKGGRELYRGSKAALNQFMRSYAARRTDSPRALILLAPGWIRTDLGGPNAPFSLEETVPQIVGLLLTQSGQPGLRYLDRAGATVPW